MMQDLAHRTYFTAVELEETGRAATLLISFESGKIIARLKSADDEQLVVLGRDDGQDFKSRTVKALLILVAAGFDEFRGVRYSYLPHIYSVDPRLGNPGVETSIQTRH